MKTSRLNGPVLITLALTWSLQACTTPVRNPPDCAAGMQRSAHGCAPRDAVEDARINEVVERRTWYPSSELPFDPVQLAADAEIPIQNAYGKIIGPSAREARDALVVKLYLIEHAQHTVDMAYYIFATDLVGYAMIGALCRAVQRGVDIRLTVDASGSIGASKTSLRALKRCEDRAGFVRNAEGAVTTRKARVQLMLFNAITNFAASVNRRSHDKLMVVDGAFPGKAWVMTGGRNISLAYYGVSPDGQVDPDSYMDSEILLRPDPEIGGITVGDVSESYYSLLSLFQGNKPLFAVRTPQAQDLYRAQLAKAFDALRQLENMALLKPHYDNMPDFLRNGFASTRILLSHEMTNLVARRPVREVIANLASNPNSIMYVLNEIRSNTADTEVTQIVSPYLFLAQYQDEEGQAAIDEAQEIRAYLEGNPHARFEVVTNSLITSDNFSAQSIIDFDTAPRLLLDEELQAAWLEAANDPEKRRALTQSDEWIRQVNHPQVAVYETGRLDSDYFQPGGVIYGKLHAKFFVEDDIGFLGTSNFDYRSRLYNNEMGFFLQSDGLTGKLRADFEELKRRSYRWGSPEWLEMREKARQLEGIKGWSARQQHVIYKTLRATGLFWQF